MGVTLRLPAVLADSVGGPRALHVDPAPGSVGALFDALATSHPALERRVRDEQGVLRRFVNVYVGGEDIRFGEALQTPVADGAEVQILPAVAGG